MLILERMHQLAQGRSRSALLGLDVHGSGSGVVHAGPSVEREQTFAQHAVAARDQPERAVDLLVVSLGGARIAAVEEGHAPLPKSQLRLRDDPDRLLGGEPCRLDGEAEQRARLLVVDRNRHGRGDVGNEDREQRSDHVTPGSAAFTRSVNPVPTILLHGHHRGPPLAERYRGVARSSTGARRSGRASSSRRSPARQRAALRRRTRSRSTTSATSATRASFPFTRGVYPSMYRGRLWTMRQFAGFGTAEETNERFRYLLEHGQTGLSTAFDMPTLMGYDSDHPRSLGEVGREGVAIDSLADMETLFDGHPARRGLDVDDDQRAGGDRCSRSTSASASSRACRAAGSAGRSRRTSSRSTSRRRSDIFPPEPSMRLVTDMVEFCARGDAAVAPDLDLRLPHPRGGLDGGAGARVHARGRLRLRRGGDRARARRRRRSRRGSPSSSTRTSTSSRRSRSTARRGGSGRASCASATARRTRASLLMRFHTQTAGVSLTAQQPEVNIVRTAIEALAAVLGGTQSLHTNSFDEALALPDRGRGADRAAHAAGDRARDRRRRTRSTRSAAPTTSRS